MARVDDLVSNSPQALTAAISAVSPSEVSTIGAAVGVGAYWRFYRQLPDIRYIVNLEGRLLSMSNARLEWLNEVGVWIPAPTIPEAAMGAMTVLHDSPGGLPDIAGRFAQQFVVDGQTYLCGYDEKRRLRIEALSSSELKSNGSQFFRDRGARLHNGSLTSTHEDLPRSAKVSRVWRRHPEHSGRAETALEALVDDMETLIYLNAALRARVRSRLAAAGILFLPNSLVVASPGQTPDGTGGPADEVTRKILEAMAAAIEDPNSADASMPIVIRGPDDVGEKIKHITLDRLIDESEMRLRSELRENILHGMDAPKEVASAQDKQVNTNHWNEASVKMELWHHTVAPIGDAMWEGLTQMVLVPWLAKNNVEGNYRWRVDRDSVQIRNNQDEKTRVGLDRGLIGDTAARRRLGIDPGDAPTTAEYVRHIGRQMAIPELAFYEMDVDIDYDAIASRKSGPPKSGDGRDMPAETPNDVPEGDRDRRVR